MLQIAIEGFDKFYFAVIYKVLMQKSVHAHLSSSFEKIQLSSQHRNYSADINIENK